MTYPIDIQDFDKLREQGYNYFENTAIIQELVTQEKNYCQSVEKVTIPEVFLQIT